MSSGSSASFCLIVCFLVYSSEALKNITAELGQDVTLTCKADNNNKPIRVVEWSRPDLDSVDVLLYRNGRFDPHIQHPSYKNRADLKDREMKDGDVSLILKNVKMEDKGRYECRVVQGETGGMNIDPTNIINLEVLPPGDKDGGDKDGGDEDGGDKVGGHKDGGDKDVNTGDGGNKVGIIVGTGLGVILLAVTLVGFCIYERRNMRQNSKLPIPPDEAAAEQIPVTAPESASEQAVEMN